MVQPHQGARSQQRAVPEGARLEGGVRAEREAEVLKHRQKTQSHPAEPSQSPREPGGPAALPAGPGQGLPLLQTPLGLHPFCQMHGPIRCPSTGRMPWDQILLKHCSMCVVPGAQWAPLQGPPCVDGA